MASDGLRCPACTAPLSQEPWALGLCLSCLVGLAASPVPLAAGPAAEDDLPTADVPGDPFVAGGILGHRYRIRSLLGRGGMGEVWRALDLKLRVNVALKALRSRGHPPTRALEGLRSAADIGSEPDRSSLWAGLFDLRENLLGRTLEDLRAIAA